MNLDTDRTSAKIYSFPRGGRRNITAGGGRSRTEAVSALPATVANCGAWYHEAAIREDAVRTTRPTVLPTV